MILKFAQSEDLPEIEALYHGFAASLPYDALRVTKSIAEMIDRNSVIVAIVEGKIVGGIAGYFFESLFNSEIYFVTYFSYFREAHRHQAVQFFRQIEALLETTKATKFFVGVPYYQDEEKMGRFYQMQGFRSFERHYVKDIGASKGEPQCQLR